MLLDPVKQMGETINVTQPKFAKKKKKFVPTMKFMKTIKNLLFFNSAVKSKPAVVLYKVSNMIKNFLFLPVRSVTILFLRKQRIFNKGRYSRNRQLYRTGVY
jgi:hypothetical protein